MLGRKSSRLNRWREGEFLVYCSKHLYRYVYNCSFVAKIIFPEFGDCLERISFFRFIIFTYTLANLSTKNIRGENE